MTQRVMTTITVIVVLLVSIGASCAAAQGAVINANRILPSIQQVHRQDDFNQTILELMEQARLPSLSIGLLKNASLVFYRGFGEYNLLTGRPPTNETIYALGSISKSITATAIMQLYEQGKFNLDDNVSEWLPFDLKNPKYHNINITFRMLLAHQSSLYEYNIENISSLMKKIGPLRTLKMLISFPFIPNVLKEPYPMLKELLVPGGKIYMKELWMDYPPGAEANYSNLGYVILGYLVERMSNQSMENYCQTHIFDPLKMNDTRYNPKGSDRLDTAIPYITGQGGTLIRRPHHSFIYFAPAGGMCSSVEDLSHFLIAHMNNGTYNDFCLLNSSTVALMHTIQYQNSSYTPPNSSVTMKFGLGWIFTTDEQNDTWGGHFGEIPGSIAFMRVRTSDNKGFIAYYNRTGLNETEANAVKSIIQTIKEKLNEI